jgi:hypothetical protein
MKRCLVAKDAAALLTIANALAHIVAKLLVAIAAQVTLKQQADNQSNLVRF